MSTSLIEPSYSVVFVIAAIFTCFVGCHTSMSLAAATLRLRLRKLTILTGLLFSVQSIFSLHFVAMAGMDMGHPWGFDIGLFIASVVVIVLCGTAAIALALWLRLQSEAALMQAFPDHHGKQTFRKTLRTLRFLLQHISTWKLILAVVVLVVGAAGCHHLGMWSMGGMDGVLLMTELNLWSFLCTVGIGGLLCVVTILAFLAVPEGPAAWGTAALLTLGIAAFHFSSAQWGMRYVLGQRGVATNVYVGQDAVFLLVILQGAISQVIASTFSGVAVQHFNEADRQLQVASALGWHLARMDLERARQVSDSCATSSPIGAAFARIVDNLELYRPYLPDTLFQSRGAPYVLEAVPTSSKSESMHFLKTVRPRTPVVTAPTPRAADNSPLDSLPGEQCIDFSTGLRSTRSAVLYLGLQRLGFGESAFFATPEGVEDALVAFLGLVTSKIKGHNGTLVMCSGGRAIGFWKSGTPETAVECGLSILQHSALPITGVVVCGPHLLGSLASPHCRAFQLVGPRSRLAEQLLHVGHGRKQLFITKYEVDAVSLRHCCLPYELVALDGQSLVVFSVLPISDDGGDDEWMYRIADNQSSGAPEALKECWAAYCGGDYGRAYALAEQLSAVPHWYLKHLRTLLDHAKVCGLPRPVKDLQVPAWSTLAAPPGSPHRPPQPTDDLCESFGPHPFWT